MRLLSHRVLLACLPALLCSVSAHAQDPVKVFILAGQSNMEGKGTVEGATTPGTLRYNVINDAANFGHLVDASNNWVTRSDVNIYSTTDGGESGGLTVGYGSNVLIGPELGFGVEVGNLYGEDVLLIKTAWGGKSLVSDFRPPSAVLKRGGEVGFYYDQMLTEVNNVLSNLGTYVPGYSGQGYDIQGFGWHQGYNDRINSTAVAEYEENLADFINDVRFELGASDLPFVLATTSMENTINTQAQNLIDAQLAVGDPAQYPEFDGNVVSIDARPFWFTSAQSPANEGYHWNRNARTYYLMGEAMGEAMATMSSYAQFQEAYIEVNQQTGEVKIINPGTNTADMDLEAYAITSASGALNPADWDSIAGNYDNNGDSSVDVGTWLVTSSQTGELAEAATPGGTDGLIAIGNEVSLGVGAWQGALVKDLFASYTDTDGNVIDLNIRYSGFDNILGDLTTDGVIDVNDWARFVLGIQLDMSSLSSAQAYLLGDLDGDLDNDIDDFDAFRRAYELANPEPLAFQQMLQQYADVPEPSSLLLFAGGAFGLFSRRRRPSRCRQEVRCLKKSERRAAATPVVLSTAVMVAMLAGTAGAQEMFNVNIFAYGRNLPNEWQQQSWRDTVLLDPADVAGAPGYSSDGWQNVQASTGAVALNGSSGSSATFNLLNQRNASPYNWTRTRNDADTVDLGNAQMLDGHSVGTEDPYDQSKHSIFTVSNIPFAFYDVVLYLGINAGQKFDGIGTLSFNGNVQNFVMPTGEPDGSLTPIVNDSTPGNYIVYEQLSGSSFNVEIVGDDFTHMGPAGFQVVEIVDPVQLKLQVNTATGSMTLMGDNVADVDMNYYQVTSAGDSLDATGWNSLADQDIDGNGPANGSGDGWEEGFSVGAHGLAEAYLLGETTIGAGSQTTLGAAYDTGVDARDLAFRYRSANGSRFDGVVEYITTVPGDTDGDGDIDDSDLGTMFSNYTGPVGAAGGKTEADGDTDGDGDVDDSDLGTGFSGYTGPLVPANVPEPASFIACAGIGLLLLSRRKRSC